MARRILVTGMVGEFPELQGVIGGYYARAEGYPHAVADAIRDHYKPVGQGDAVPTAPVTVAVSLADKLDSFLSFFAIGDTPSGSRDPFGLRRSSLGVIAMTQHLPSFPFLRIARFHRLLLAESLEGSRTFFREFFDGNDLRVRMAHWDFLEDEGGWFLFSDDPLIKRPVTDWSIAERRARIHIADPLVVEDNGLVFFADRLKVQQREAGVRHDLIDAVFALGGEDDLVRLLARVKALQAFVATEDGANLLAGYRRAANIVRIETKKDGDAGVPTSQDTNGSGYDREPAETALIAALDIAEPAAAVAVAAEDFEGAMQALARLRPAVDAFFDQVTVNDPDPARRTARLALLDRIRVAVHNVADFSRIEG